jgi:hypothetical protein
MDIRTTITKKGISKLGKKGWFTHAKVLMMGKREAGGRGW